MDIGSNNYFFKKLADLQDRVAELEEDAKPHQKEKELEFLRLYWKATLHLR